MQRALLQFKNPKYYTLVYDALTEAGRMDLIGNDPKCLIRDKSNGNSSSNNTYRKNKVHGENSKSNSYKGNGNIKEKRVSKTEKVNDKSSYVQGKFKDKNEVKYKGKNESRHTDKTQTSRGKSTAMGKGKASTRTKSKRK